MTDQLLRIPKPVTTRHHLAQAVSIKGLKADMQKVDGFNAKIAVFVTNIVGSMWCAYLFCLIALTSLPAIITGTGWIPKTRSHPGSCPSVSLPSWRRSPRHSSSWYFPVIMVGQNVQSIASDARSEHTYEDTVKSSTRSTCTPMAGSKTFTIRWSNTLMTSSKRSQSPDGVPGQCPTGTLRLRFGRRPRQRAGRGGGSDLMRMEWSPSGRNPSNGQTRLILLPVSASVSESPLRWGQACAHASPSSSILSASA